MPNVSSFKRLTCLFFIHNGRSYYTAPAYMQKRAVSRPVLLGLSPPPPWSSIRDRSLFIEGVGEDLGLNKAKFSWSPLWRLLYWSDPLNNFWWLSWSPLRILPKFSAIPFWVLSYDWSPHPLPAGDKINNDRSLMSSLPCSGEKCSLISRTVASSEVLSISILRFSRNRINITIALCTSH